jgi:hypothetical protein
MFCFGPPLPPSRIWHVAKYGTATGCLHCTALIKGCSTYTLPAYCNICCTALSGCYAPNFGEMYPVDYKHSSM